MKSRSGQKIKLTSVEELLGVANEEVATEIELQQIQSFQNHPFKVLDDEKMQDLVSSICENGILTPVLVRPIGNDKYEMISGHRRMHAAGLLQMNVIPAIIRDMSDEEAIVKMVDSNIQREELLPSEKAFAYKMKLDAMKKQGKRTDLTSGQNDQKLSGRVSRDLLAEEMGESSKQIQRYIRLTELQPKLLDLVDSKRLNFTVAVDISYIDKEIQNWLYDYIDANGIIIPNQVKTLRKAIDSGKQIGPLIQHTKLNQDELKVPELFLGVQCNKILENIGKPYIMEKEVYIKNCIYCRYIGPENKQNFAYEKILLEAFERDILLNGNIYTIVVDQNDELIITDVFMEKEQITSIDAQLAAIASGQLALCLYPASWSWGCDI